MPFGKAPLLLYPRVYNITDILDVVGKQQSYGDSDSNLNWGFFTDESCQSIVKPKITHAHPDKVNRTGAYVMDNGEYISLFIGSEIEDSFPPEVSNPTL